MRERWTGGSTWLTSETGWSGTRPPARGARIRRRQGGDDSLDAQMRDQMPDRIREEVATHVTAGSEDNALSALLPDLSSDEPGRLAIIDPGTAPSRGAIHLDPNNLEKRPFKGIDGHEADPTQRLNAKSETDHELWNRLAGREGDPTLERPEPCSGRASAQGPGWSTVSTI